MGLEFSADGKRLAVGCDALFGAKGLVYLFDLDDGRGIRTLRGLSGRIQKLIFSKEGTRIAALTHDWQVAIWDRERGHLLRQIDVPVGMSLLAVVLVIGICMAAIRWIFLTGWRLRE